MGLAHHSKRLSVNLFWISVVLVRANNACVLLQRLQLHVWRPPPATDRHYHQKSVPSFVTTFRLLIKQIGQNNEKLSYLSLCNQMARHSTSFLEAGTTWVVWLFSKRQRSFRYSRCRVQWPLCPSDAETQTEWLKTFSNSTYSSLDVAS